MTEETGKNFLIRDLPIHLHDRLRWLSYKQNLPMKTIILSSFRSYVHSDTPVKKAKSGKHFLIRNMPIDVHFQLREESVQRGVSMRQLIIDSIDYMTQWYEEEYQERRKNNV